MLTPPVEPILARAADTLPDPRALPGERVFEPKWDGYRLLVFTTSKGRPFLQSRGGADLTGAFPEITDAASRLEPGMILDGEVIIQRGGRLDFPALQQRMAARRSPRRAAALAAQEPAHLVVFDLLQRTDEQLLDRPYRARRTELEDVFDRHTLTAPWVLTPASTDTGQARTWMEEWTAVGCEGVVVKGDRQRYTPARRLWIKVRTRVTALAILGAVTGPLHTPHTALLGRYDDHGTLRLVARTTPLRPAARADLGSLVRSAGAGHPWRGMRLTARWGSRDPIASTPVVPEHVVAFAGDVAIDQGRWRHPVRLLRRQPEIGLDEIPRFGSRPL